MAQWTTTPPANGIVGAGVPIEMEWEAASTITPGDVVEFDVTDCPRIKAAADDAVGVLGVADIAMASATGAGAKRGSPYLINMQVKVVSGDIFVMLRLAASNAIVCGDHVQPGGTGMVKKYICGTDEACQLLAQAVESKAEDTEATQWLYCKWLKGG